MAVHYVHTCSPAGRYLYLKGLDVRMIDVRPGMGDIMFRLPAELFRQYRGLEPLPTSTGLCPYSSTYDALNLYWGERLTGHYKGLYARYRMEWQLVLRHDLVAFVEKISKKEMDRLLTPREIAAKYFTEVMCEEGYDIRRGTVNR
jgi:hypothetical protein